MSRILRSPGWWLGHLAVVVVVLVMLRLGLWQWHRATSPSGGIQNYAYAVQWPLFAVFGIVLYVKTIRLEIAGYDGERPTTRLGATPLPEPEITHAPGVRIGITTAVTPVDPDDDEVTMYNAYLASLNARSASAAARSRR